ncbi:hypothetical protein B0H63DRAFT_115283 [Podospora didyma]|uniref:DUF2415 domain-containing protein n=1 Tax=Podospora didyma TaxID=330526 RepID=A0AAE0NZ40_9PEZI|nr:hypothetical protein B0H63DRAFT_115283 [Podospora didyma]
MANKHDDYYPAEDLILSTPRRHYRTTVRALHWQLRSLIGVEKQNIVYFPTGTDNQNVRRLNTTTHETETIKRLPFEPRCLVAQNGWVCCGGEKGEFAAIRVGEGQNSPDDGADMVDLDPDARLPIDLIPPHPDNAIFSSLARARSNKSLLAKTKVFGAQLVNCITLWSPPVLALPFEGAYGSIVAVLANNDRKVTVVSLPEQEALDTLSFPDCVNRAVISPNGQLLVTIGDDPYLYIHERTAKAPGHPNPFRNSRRPSYEWTSCGKIQLKGQSKEDRSEHRGSFAACFSSTGRYLAVGTQYGIISIFDAAALTVPELDPLITSFSSSRSSADMGAVRDMTFAPGPMDLLAWTEDRGRVGIADVRSGFISRQILHLDKLDDFEHISVTDRSTIDPRLLEARGERNDTFSSSFASTLDLSLDSQLNRRSDGRDTLERYHFPLTPDETLVLEALQEHRRRQEQRNAGPVGAGPRMPWTERNPRAALAAENARSRERSVGVSRAVSEILGNIRDQRERIRDSQDRLRATMREDNTSADRRRGAGAPPLPARGGDLGGSAATATSNSDRRGMLNPRLVANTPPPASSSWGNVEALYNPSPDGILPSESIRTATDADSRRRDRAAYIMREWEDPSRRGDGTMFMQARAVRPYDPLDTAGISWSEDGQLLSVHPLHSCSISFRCVELITLTLFQARCRG